MATPKAARARVAERRTQAIELRCAGASWETIAATLGYATRGAACNDVARALDQRLAALGGQADRLRQLALERLDATLRAVWPLLDSDDPATVVRAAGTVVRIEERRARLEGTDAPAQVAAAVAVTQPVYDGPPRETLDQMLARIAANWSRTELVDRRPAVAGNGDGRGAQP
jgi:hypothetical protein